MWGPSTMSCLQCWPHGLAQLTGPAEPSRGHLQQHPLLQGIREGVGKGVKGQDDTCEQKA